LGVLEEDVLSFSKDQVFGGIQQILLLLVDDMLACTQILRLVRQQTETHTHAQFLCLYDTFMQQTRGY
jgi:hypothetical protein